MERGSRFFFIIEVYNISFLKRDEYEAMLLDGIHKRL